MKEYNITGNTCKATVVFIAADERRKQFPKLQCTAQETKVVCLNDWSVKIYERANKAKGNEQLAKLINCLDGEKKGIVPKLFLDTRQEKWRVVIDLDESVLAVQKWIKAINDN